MGGGGGGGGGKTALPTNVCNKMLSLQPVQVPSVSSEAVKSVWLGCADMLAMGYYDSI